MTAEHLEHLLTQALRDARLRATEEQLRYLHTDRESALLEDAQAVEYACELGLSVLNPAFIPSAEAHELLEDLLARRP